MKVITMSGIECNMTYKELAEATGTSISTVRRRLIEAKENNEQSFEWNNYTVFIEPRVKRISAEDVYDKYVELDEKASNEVIKLYKEIDNLKQEIKALKVFTVVVLATYIIVVTVIG